MRARERERERERTRGRETAAKAEREEEVDLLLRGRTQPSRPWRVDTETAHPCPVLFGPASTPAVLVFCCPRFLQTFFSGILWSFSPCAILWSACLSMLSSHLLTVYVQAKFASIFFNLYLYSAVHISFHRSLFQTVLFGCPIHTWPCGIHQSATDHGHPHPAAQRYQSFHCPPTGLVHCCPRLFL